MLFKACKLQLLPNSPLVSGLALSLCPQCTWHDLWVFRHMALLSGGLPAWSHQLGLSQAQTFIPCGGLPRSRQGRPTPLNATPASVPSPWQSQVGPRSSVHLQLLQGQSWHTGADTWPSDHLLSEWLQGFSSDIFICFIPHPFNPAGCYFGIWYQVRMRWLDSITN